MFRVIVFSLLFLTQTMVTQAEQYVAPGHYGFHWWYKQIQTELNITGCCDEENNDCGPVGSSYIDLGADGVKVKMEDGNWYVAANVSKYYVDTPDGGAHVCRQPAIYGPTETYGGQKFLFYCIFLPLPSV